ncbi:MAG: hypothetical protein HRU16_09000 [Planctomycetes bacterium]|nr:hypothetical protein [Planctomycetota bacterium]
MGVHKSTAVADGQSLEELGSRVPPAEEHGIDGDAIPVGPGDVIQCLLNL